MRGNSDLHWVQAKNRYQAATAAQKLENGPVVVLMDAVEVQHLDPGITATLSSKEVARAERFRSPLSRSEFCVGRGLVRVMASQALKRSEANIDILLSRYGKPYIDNRSDLPLNFSISHSAGSVVVAMAYGIDIGVDLELSNVSLQHLANKFLSEKEYRIVTNLPEAKLKVHLLRLWRIKEAILKAAGLGLLADPRSVEVLQTEDPSVNPSSSVEWLKSMWFIEEGRFRSDVDVAVAMSMYPLK